MTGYVIDTSAWVEYFLGTDIGKRVSAIVEDETNTVITHSLTIAELASIITRKKENIEEIKKTVFSLSILIDLDHLSAHNIGKAHGEIRKKRKKISMTDVTLIHTARKSKAKLVTKDQDFRGMKDVILLK